MQFAVAVEQFNILFVASHVMEMIMYMRIHSYKKLRPFKI